MKPEFIMAALAVACLALGLWYASFYGKSNRKKGLAVKAAASAAFVALAVVCFSQRATGYGAAILAALIAGAAADVIIGARFISVRHKQKFFLAGAAVFAVGHIAYLFAINRLHRVEIVYYIIGIAIGAALCGIPMLLKKVHYGKLRAPLFGYAVILGSMLLSAVSYAAAGGAGWQAVLAAAALFAVSDFVLLIMTFAKGSMFGNVLNLFTYYSAQTLFALSILWCG